MSVAKRIVMAIGRTSAQVIVDALVTELSSLNTNHAPLHHSELEFSSRFSSLLSDSEYSDAIPIARGHLALILLAELSYELGEELVPHLPILLHLSFLAFDNPQQPVHEHSRILLLNIIHSMVTKLQYQRESEKYLLSMELEDFLKSKEGKQLWANEDMTVEHPDIKSARELHSLVTRVTSVLYQGKELNEKWANEGETRCITVVTLAALTWAISCPSYHLVGRSYQIYRSLRTAVTRDTIIDVLKALWKFVTRAAEPQSAGLALEILYTLQVMVEGLDSQKLILFTQIFWGAVALLHTNYELHFRGLH